MPRRKVECTDTFSSENLEAIVQKALELTKKAKRHKMNLSGDNFYAQKFATLRAEATNLFTELTGNSVGDVSAIAEMIGHVFSPITSPKSRRNNACDLLFSLRTTWRRSIKKTVSSDPDPIFPTSLLAQTKRGYLIAIGRQINGCFRVGHFDASAVMMRRLLEVSIIEAFEARGIASVIKNIDGDYLHLSDLVKKTMSETSWHLSRNTKKFLPQLRDIGHSSAHGRYFTAQESDIMKLQPGIRFAVEELLRIANLF